MLLCFSLTFKQFNYYYFFHKKIYYYFSIFTNDFKKKKYIDFLKNILILIIKIHQYYSSDILIVLLSVMQAFSMLLFLKSSKHISLTWYSGTQITKHGTKIDNSAWSNEVNLY